MAFDFNTVSLLLSVNHGIAISKLSKFQARLKNLHRVGWPLDFQSTKGKPSQYSVGDLVDIALAVELMQLGLAPERIVYVLRTNRWPTLMAYRMAARNLAEHPKDFIDNFLPEVEITPEEAEAVPQSMFVYFDPTALLELSVSSLSGPHAAMDGIADGEDDAAASFFYGGIGIVSETLGGWNTIRTRISLINISALLHGLAANRYHPGSLKDIDYRRDFFRSIEDWAKEALKDLENAEAVEEAYMMGFIQRSNVENDIKLAELTGVDPKRANRYIIKYIEDVIASKTENGGGDGERS